MIMKKYALLYSILAAAGGIGMLSAEGGGKVIDLNKPVGDSLVPDGFYWTFDDGIAGESEPLIVQDHSGNQKGLASAHETSPPRNLNRFNFCRSFQVANNIKPASKARPTL